jgi:hypothetical protein
VSRLRLPPLAFVLAICSLPTSGQAHQALESSAQIETTAENLEVTITLAQTYAPALLDPAPTMPLTPGNFDAVRPALLAVAPKVGAATDAAGATIPPARVLVSLTAEGEIRYLFLYPAELRPAGFGMPALATLPRGYFCTLSDQRSTPPGRVILHKDHPLHAFPALP